MEDPYKPPHGMIDLSKCLTVKGAESKLSKPHCFEVTTKQEKYFLCAESDKLKDEWIGRIGKAIVVHSSSYKTSPLTPKQY